jgi:hypothetical protein
MELLLKAALVTLCVIVFVGAVCRIDLMRAGKHRQAWISMYTLAAIFAAGTVLDLAHGRTVEWWTAGGIVALVLQLAATRALWVKGPPPNITKGTT